MARCDPVRLELILRDAVDRFSDDDVDEFREFTADLCRVTRCGLHRERTVEERGLHRTQETAIRQPFSTPAAS